jgi:hypothetical protein
MAMILRVDRLRAPGASSGCRKNLTSHIPNLLHETLKLSDQRLTSSAVSPCTWHPGTPAGPD